VARIQKLFDERVQDIDVPADGCDVHLDVPTRKNGPYHAAEVDPRLTQFCVPTSGV
jgi:hypothetical protein